MAEDKTADGGARGGVESVLSKCHHLDLGEFTHAWDNEQREPTSQIITLPHHTKKKVHNNSHSHHHPL